MEKDNPDPFSSLSAYTSRTQDLLSSIGPYHYNQPPLPGVEIKLIKTPKFEYYGEVLIGTD